MNIVDAGDDAVLAIVADAPGDAATTAVLSLWRAVVAAKPPWLIAAQPAYTTLQVVFSAAVDACDVRAFLLQIRPLPRLGPPRTVEIPVHYDGPDLDDVAARCGLSVDEVVERHTARRYRVAFLGFLKGFAYLLGLDEKLRVPRLETPRARVPAGSVGLAGDQTGIYPSSTPGGWRLIGHTKRPFLAEDWCRPDDVVVFKRAP